MGTLGRAALDLAARAWPDLHALRIARNYLAERDWVASWHAQEPRDRNGPLPWLTYPAITFLERRVQPNWRVFEYGAGASTLWWARRVASVMAVEHDPEWHRHLAATAPARATVVHADVDSDGYVRAASDAGMFDVAVIDGRRRVECVPYAIEALTERGVVVFDNSDRKEYRPGLEMLSDSGFRHIEFAGIGPVGVSEWETAVFYRDGNCLHI